MWAFLCNSGFEGALIEEMGTLLAKGAKAGKAGKGRAIEAELRGPGLVVVEHGDHDDIALEKTDFIFARQVLPAATIVAGTSIAKLVDAIYPILRGALDDQPWSLDVTPLDPVAFGALRRAALVEEVLLTVLKERRKRIFRNRTKNNHEAGAARVQIVLIGRDEALVSLQVPVVVGGGLWPSPFPAGRPVIKEDREAPSSAYRKLLEAQAWMGTEIASGDHCVDLGAAPGGWSYIALLAGATLTTVDRAVLDPRLARHRRIQHLRSDAFSFRPEGGKLPVDWLLCDVIAEPQKSIALLLKWAAEGWAKRIVLDVKFKGHANYGLLRPVASKLRSHFKHVRIKQLENDGNEVTVMAW